MEALPKGIYRHYKGNSYEVLGTAFHSETEEPMVVYKSLYESTYPSGTLWVRPLSMFTENITIDGSSVPRFRLVK